MGHKRCILLFAKYPEKGHVKSRLAADLGEETARRLYQCFVLDFVETLENSRFPVKIFFYPPDAGAGMEQRFGSGHSYIPQRGGDLGERMKNAFTDTFSEGFSEAVLIGSDIPDMTDRAINEAFMSLDNHEAAIGPAVDGGYYLVGFRKSAFLPEIFNGITWSADTVFDSTMKIFRKSGYSVHILPEWSDVDTLADLKKLYERNKDTEFRNSRTMALLDNMG